MYNKNPLLKANIKLLIAYQQWNKSQFKECAKAIEEATKLFE